MEWLNKKGFELEKVISGLKQTYLVTFEDDVFMLLSDECAVVAVKGKWYAAENKAGRLTNWINKVMKK